MLGKNGLRGYDSWQKGITHVRNLSEFWCHQAEVYKISCIVTSILKGERDLLKEKEKENGKTCIVF